MSENANDFQLHKTRFSAQSAEKLGWSIGGYSIAYALKGEIGIICFGLTMFFVASIFTIYFRKNDVKFGKDLLKQSILYRISSFSILIFAVMLENYHLLLLGSALSGIYVSMFWPSFYSLKRSSVSRWYVNEKFYACILLLVSGICISKFGPNFVIILASIAAIFAYFQASEISELNDCKNSKYQSANMWGMLALSEGIFASIINIWRAIILISGSIVVFEFTGIISFSLLLVMTKLLGAIFTHYSKSIIEERFRIISVTTISMSGIILISLPSTNLWLVGILIMGVATSAMYPLTIEAINSHLNFRNQNNRGFREDWRNRGRVTGATILFCLYYLEISYHSLPFFLLILILIYSKIMLRGGRAL